MTTKDFKNMTTAELNALLETASGKEKKVIEKIISERAVAAGQAEGQVYENEDPLSPEERVAQEAGNEAEKKKLTAEELHSLIEELKAKFVGHKCQVVPFNTLEWVSGYIAGVIEEKRSMKALFAIRTEDGRRIVKVYDSPYIRISEETAEKVKVTRTRTVTTKKETWTGDDINAGIAKLSENVGKLIELDGMTGRVMSVVPEKRAQTFMYRIEVETVNEAGEPVVKVLHKVYTNENMKLIDDFDEKGLEINKAFLERRANIMSKQKLTPEERITILKNDVTRAEEQVKIWSGRLDARKKALEAAMAEYSAEQPVEDSATESSADDLDDLA